MYSPLEQFEIVVFIGINLLGLVKIVLTNAFIYLGMGFFVYLAIAYMLYYEIEYKLIGNVWSSLVEGCYKFVLNIVKEQLGKEGVQYFPLIFLIFVFIVSANLLGLIPYSFTTTSHIIITFLMALTVNISLLILGFRKHGIKFLGLFIPKGIKGVLLPLIVVIEIFSYVIRSVSLSVRLFANMLAGHTLIHLILTFGVVILRSKYVIVIIAPLFFFLAIYALEMVIAVVQAYVFILLSCIYLKESLHLHA
jgi:ATP synthase subunit 6